MAGKTRRIGIVYASKLPPLLLEHVNSDRRLSITREGLCDFPPIRAMKAIVHMEWTNSPSDAALLKRMEMYLKTFKLTGGILHYEFL